MKSYRASLLSQVTRHSYSHESIIDISMEVCYILLGSIIMLIPTLVGLILLVPIYLLILCFDNRKRETSNSGSAPRVPLFGHLFHFLVNSNFLKNPPSAFLQISSLDNGDGVVIDFGVLRPYKMKLITKASTASEILKSNSIYFKGPAYDAFREVTPKHLPGLDGANATIMRMKYIKSVSRHLDMFAKLSFEHHFSLIDSIAEMKSTVCLNDTIRFASLSVIYTVAFGEKIDMTSETVRIFISALHFLMTEWHERIVAIVPWFKFPLFPRNRRVYNARNIFSSFIKDKMSTPILENCLLRTLVEEGSDMDEVVNIIFTFLAMGHENVSSVVTWAWFHLLKDGDNNLSLACQDLVEKVKEKKSLVVNYWEMLKSIMDERCAVQYFTNELLRMYPAVPMLSRTNKESNVVEEILVCPYVQQRLPLWEASSTFKYDRWDKLGKDSPQMDYYMPFGIGDRGCPGQLLGRIQVFSAILSYSKLHLWKNLVPVSELQSVSPEMKISLRPSLIYVKNKKL